MRAFVLCLAAAAIVAIPASPKPSSDLQGVWDPVWSHEIRNHVTTEHIPSGQTRWKMFSKNRFVWVAYDVQQKKFIATGGGTYKIDGDTYSETIEFFSENPALVGKTLNFKFRREGNRYWQSGLVGEVQIEEEWKQSD
jgi:hypothetical protein